MKAVDCGDPSVKLGLAMKFSDPSAKSKTNFPNTHKVICTSHRWFTDLSSVKTISCTAEGKWTDIKASCGTHLNRRNLLQFSINNS